MTSAKYASGIEIKEQETSLTYHLVAWLYRIDRTVRDGSESSGEEE